eukprot:scaffold124119_cov51-Phaeocystis_antarctica.AAC.1
MRVVSTGCAAATCATTSRRKPTSSALLLGSFCPEITGVFAVARVIGCMRLPASTSGASTQQDAPDKYENPLHSSHIPAFHRAPMGPRASH